MKYPYIFAAAAVFALMAACSSPQDRAASADAEMTQKRMKMADDYQECTKLAAAYEQAKKDGTADRVPSDEQKTTEQCDEIMKMMEALK
jgi:hypothetical protein